MNPACEEFLEALLAGPLSKEQLSHTVVCESCRALLGPHVLYQERAPAPSATLGGVFREEIRAELQAELARQPRALTWWAAPFGFMALNLMLLALAVWRLGADNWRLSQLSFGRMGISVGLLFFCVAFGTLVSVMPRGRNARFGMLVFTVLIPLAVLLGADGQRVCRTVAQALPCSGVEALLSIVPLGAGIFLLSRVAWQPLRVWLAMASSAAVGLLALELHCLDGSTAHLLWFHLLPWAALCAIAMLVRSRIQARSFAN